MIVLAIDAALGAFSAAVAREGEPLAVEQRSGSVALEQGLAVVSSVLREAGIEPHAVDRLAVGIGPGSFTGVRIAISYAKSLALGWQRPLVGVDSFDALEAGAPLTEPLLAVVRGRRGVVSVRYRAGGAQRRASGYVNDVLDELSIAHSQIAIIGDAEDVLPALAERGCSVQTVERAIIPSALAIASVAAAREPARSSHELRADYGELPAAKIPRKAGPP